MVEDDVVVLGVLPGVRVRVADDRPHAVDAAQVAEVLVVDVEVAQQDDVVFAAARAAHGLVDLAERVELGFGFVGVGVDIDEHERERLLRRRAADAEHRHQRLAVQQVVRIVDGEDAAAD